MKKSVPKSHPRYLSLLYRDLIADGVKKGITSLQGLTAHGRGETFDYLIGERTEGFAMEAIKAAASMLILSKTPVLSVNGNTAALCPKDLVLLSKAIPAKLEINLFHKSKKREMKIFRTLREFGAEEILLPDEGLIGGIDSNRKYINRKGQAKADVVFVPLEDGDRTEALIKMGKNVITVDLNPLSRTATKANVTVVDNIIRCLPLLTAKINEYKKYEKAQLMDIIRAYDNKKILSEALTHIVSRIQYIAKTGI